MGAPRGSCLNLTISASSRALRGVRLIGRWGLWPGRGRKQKHAIVKANRSFARDFTAAPDGAADTTATWPLPTAVGKKLHCAPVVNVLGCSQCPSGFDDKSSPHRFCF